jgi:hypothetical protein
VSRGNTRVRSAVVRKRRRSFTALAVLTSALVALLALPAFAAAIQTYEVENNGDAGTKALCEAHITNECTLRGALEAAEADPGFDLIEFALADFHGKVGESEIVVGSTPLPTITQPLSMFGFSCDYPLLGYDAPCVGVTARTGEAALTVESSGVSIEDVAFGGGSYGIEAPGASSGFVARSDWFGLKLDATANPIAAAGILLGSGADEATIGGAEASERNVFANATVGVELEGASKVKILGDYLGVGPTGLGVASLEEGVRIVDTMSSPAEENEVGGILTGPEVGTTRCDGPCNVIATHLGQGVNLAGSAAEPATAASGPTTIRANYLGLGADGTTLVGDESNYAVLAAPSTGTCGAGPGDVTVGGISPTETNYIEGGTFGIAAESAENFSVLGNAIGIAPDGSPSESPEAVAIDICGESITEPALIAGNQMMLSPDTLGIETVFGQVEILGNSIHGGLVGIATAGAGPGGGDVIRANAVVGTDRQGMVIRDELNVVTGNIVSGSGWSGIAVEEGGEHNRIGGDQLGEANTINGTGNDNESGAIVIEGTKLTRNEVAANTGSGNFGAFIELIGHSTGEIPNDLEPPTVTNALQSSAGGTAAPDTTVRIFSKASAAPGELGTLLAVAKADAAGAWSATYATVPVGTLVAATQTSDAGTAVAGTSEVGVPVAASADPPEPEKGGTGGGSSGGGGNANPLPIPPAPTKPKVKITQDPKKKSTSTIAKFKFKAEPAAGAKFECKLDNAKWAKCRSPKTYKKLKVGKHTFRVRATASGLTSAAAVFKFTVAS